MGALEASQALLKCPSGSRCPSVIHQAAVPVHEHGGTAFMERPVALAQAGRTGLPPAAGGRERRQRPIELVVLQAQELRQRCSSGIWPRPAVHARAACAGMAWGLLAAPAGRARAQHAQHGSCHCLTSEPGDAQAPAAGHHSSSSAEGPPRTWSRSEVNRSRGREPVSRLCPMRRTWMRPRLAMLGIVPENRLFRCRADAASAAAWLLQELPARAGWVQLCTPLCRGTRVETQLHSSTALGMDRNSRS